MRSVNALELRQSLGRVLKSLAKGGSPIIVKKGREPAAVLISLKDYQERFADRAADEQRRALVERIKQTVLTMPQGKSALDFLRELRG